MKTRSISLLLATGLLCAQCARTSEPAPRVDYDQKSAEIIQAVSASVPGNWTLRRVHIKALPNHSVQRELGVVRDTILQDFATLSIQPAPSRYAGGNPRHASFAGFLRYQTKTYPVQFELSANPERLFHDQGPQATFLLEYNFPPGTSHPTEPEELLLQYVGLLGESFALEVTPGQPNAMQWQGFNRGIDQIELVK